MLRDLASSSREGSDDHSMEAKPVHVTVPTTPPTSPPPIAMSSVETQKQTGNLSGSLPLLEDLESSFGS